MTRERIGFDRELRLEWLEATAAEANSRVPLAVARKRLWTLLEGVVAGDRPRSGRGKTVTVLLRYWREVPPEAVALRDRALELWSQTHGGTALPLHWAMGLAAYPFFADVAAVVGRLVALQGNVSLAQTTRRMIELRGDRSTMIRATRRVIRSMVHWGALFDTKARGVYVALSPRQTVGPVVGPLLLEALLLRSDGHSLPLQQALNHPCLFPFELRLGIRNVRDSSHLGVFRQGGELDWVELASDQRSGAERP